MEKIYKNQINEINPLNVNDAVAKISILVEDIYEDIECRECYKYHFTLSSRLQRKIYETLRVLHKIIAQNQNLVNVATLKKYELKLKHSEKILSDIKFYVLNKGSKNAFSHLRKSYLKNTREEDFNAII